jgi:hypothetical protein
MTREHVRLGLDNPRKALLQQEPVPHSSGRDYRLRRVNSGRLRGKPQIAGETALAATPSSCRRNVL